MRRPRRSVVPTLGLVLALGLACASASALAGATREPAQATPASDDGGRSPELRRLRLEPGDPFPALARGDTLVLAPGRHLGPWRIDVPDVSILAEPGAVLDGAGLGSALTMSAPGGRVVGLHVVGVGPDEDLYEPDAAFRLDGCDDCRLEMVSAGVGGAEGVSAALRVEASQNVRVQGLSAVGRGGGPGVTSFEAPGLWLEGVALAGFLDGLYLERSDGLRLSDAEVLGSGRYGVHLMFNRGALIERVVAEGGGVGSAIMYGRDTTVRDVRLSGHDGPMAFGLLIQEEREARVERALLRGNTIGLLVVAAPGLQVRSSSFDANGFAVTLQRLPAAFDTLAAEDETVLGIEASRFDRNAFDVALDDDRAAVRLLGNAFDRAVPLDLDGSGRLALPHLAGTSLATLAARVPDVSLLAFGPAMVLWEGLEARVPGARFGLLIDPAPVLAGALADGPSPHTLAASASERAWPTLTLALLPLLGALSAVWGALGRGRP